MFFRYIKLAVHGMINYNIDKQMHIQTLKSFFWEHKTESVGHSSSNSSILQLI